MLYTCINYYISIILIHKCYILICCKTVAAFKKYSKSHITGSKQVTSRASKVSAGIVDGKNVA